MDDGVPDVDVGGAAGGTRWYREPSNRVSTTWFMHHQRRARSGGGGGGSRRSCLRTRSKARHSSGGSGVGGRLCHLLASYAPGEHALKPVRVSAVIMPKRKLPQI